MPWRVVLTNSLILNQEAYAQTSVRKVIGYHFLPTSVA